MSDKNMDDLLSQLKSEFEPERQQQKASHPPNRKTPQSPSSGSMDEMLDELRQELESGRGRANSDRNAAAKPTSAKTSRQSVKDAAKARELLNALIDTDYRRQAHKREQQRAEIKRQQEAKLAVVKRREEERLAEEKRRQQDLLEIQQREERRERRRQEALREDAKQWLLKLDPRSEEGKWFKEFSYSYENKLQAAMDYLEAMRETGL